MFRRVRSFGGRRTALVFVLATGALVCAYGAALLRADAGSAGPPAATTESFYPATYGLRDTIAGYKILAVLSEANQACMPPGRKQLVLLSTRPEPPAPGTLPATLPQDVRTELEQQGITDADNWEFSIAGPTGATERIIENTRRWNEQMAVSGCVRTHPILTPTPLCAWGWTWLPEVARNGWGWICSLW